MKRRTKAGFRKPAFFSTVAAVLLALTLWAAVCAVGVPVMAEESDECGENLTWTLSSDGTLTIEGTGEMYNYNRLLEKGNVIYYSKPSWEGQKTLIKKVVIKEGVTSIGEYAFEDCTNLTDVIISDSVTEIGYLAFSGCTGLTEIAIPESVTKIENKTFMNCTNLQTVFIPDSVIDMGPCPFLNCTQPFDIYTEWRQEPQTWYEDYENHRWLYECNATVHWGASLTDAFPDNSPADKDDQSNPFGDFQTEVPYEDKSDSGQSDDASPQTTSARSVTSNPGLWISMVLVAAVFVGIAVYYRKRRGNNPL